MLKSNSRIFALFIWISAVCGVTPLAADVLMDKDHALGKLYKDASQFIPESFTLSDQEISLIEEKADIQFKSSHSPFIQMTVVKKGDTIIGYAFEDTVIGKWGPIHYLLGLKKGGEVLNAIVLDYHEIRGRPVAKKRFLRQYKGKTVEDPVRLRKDIDGVSGATISSRSMTDGVRKLLYIHKHIILPTQP